MNMLVNELAETELDQVCGGSSEMNMIKLQSMMSQRQLVIQLSTNMLRAINDSTKGIIGNIR